MNENDTPFQKGYAACLGGFALGANPYYINSDAFHEWNNGYMTARTQAEGQQQRYQGRGIAS